MFYDHGHATKRTSVFTGMLRPTLKARHEDNSTYVKHQHGSWPTEARVRVERTYAVGGGRGSM